MFGKLRLVIGVEIDMHCISKIALYIAIDSLRATELGAHVRFDQFEALVYLFLSEYCFKNNDTAKPLYI